MARPSRFHLPGIPQHVVQRGNNRLPCFLDDDDRQHYLRCLLQALPRFACKLHAYVLMDNHAHLLITPRDAGTLPRLMHAFARNYAGWFNDRHGRTGALWEGRYKACVVDSSRYFLACCRYIELNPVRAWMVARPGDYAWSSWRGHAGERVDPLLTAHPEYLALGVDARARALAYRGLFAEALSPDEAHEIQRHLRQQKAFGTDRFRAWVEARTGQFAGLRGPGRPRRSNNCP